jgi:hypothetical protein
VRRPPPHPPPQPPPPLRPSGGPTSKPRRPPGARVRFRFGLQHRITHVGSMRAPTAPPPPLGGSAAFPPRRSLRTGWGEGNAIIMTLNGAPVASHPGQRSNSTRATWLRGRTPNHNPKPCFTSRPYMGIRDQPKQSPSSAPAVPPAPPPAHAPACPPHHAPRPVGARSLGAGPRGAEP